MQTWSYASQTLGKLLTDFGRHFREPFSKSRKNRSKSDKVIK